jgi:oxygen-independent coproporphyrinogen-3 oxidase
MRASEPKPLGIYIQVPFCQTKCTYCNFHTGVASPAAYAPYARAVEREISDWRALHAAAGLDSAGRPDTNEQPSSEVVEREKDGSPRESHPPIRMADQELSRVNKGIKPFFAPKTDTIYLGGGTPSLFDPADLAGILEAVRSQFGAGCTGSGGTSTEVTLEADPETITSEKAAAWLPPASTASAWARNRSTTPN